MPAIEPPPGFVSVFVPRNADEDDPRRKREHEYLEAAKRDEYERRKANVSNPRYIEQTKLTGVYLTQMGSGLMIAGFAAPVIAMIAGSVSLSASLVFSTLICMAISVSLHISGRRFLKRLEL